MIKSLTIKAVILLALCLQLVSADENEVVVGVVPQFDPRHIQKVWQPILDELEARTGRKYVLSGSRSIPHFERRFKRGDYDLVYLNPYHQVIANKAQGYEPIIKDSQKKLYGILAVSKDKNIKSLADLEGEVVAFPAPNALGASLLMRTNLIYKFNINFEPKYVKNHTSVYLNTVLGLTAAGGGVMRTLNGQSNDIKSKLRIIYETERVEPHPLSVHPRLGADLKSKIQTALLAMGKSPEGRSLLAGIPMLEAGIAVQKDYEPLESMGLERVYVEE